MGIKYTSLTKKAMMICFETHKNQKDKSGMPYVFHPFHLAEQMETEDEICTALLHDVAEDSDCTIEDLKKEGFSADTIEALRLLTHEKGTDYFDYLRAIRQHPVALRVKLADIAHNSDETRYAGCDEVSAEQIDRRRQKYAKAKAILTGSV